MWQWLALAVMCVGSAWLWVWQPTVEIWQSLDRLDSAFYQARSIPFARAVGVASRRVSSDHVSDALGDMLHQRHQPLRRLAITKTSEGYHVVVD